MLFQSGGMLIDGDDKPLLPARLEVVDSKTCHLTITEGRYHQVRRMFAQTGNLVIRLHRDRIGGLDVPENLAPGQYRRLTEEELGIATLAV
jgi:16S rRNA pseudouridine516 synthase